MVHLGSDAGAVDELRVVARALSLEDGIRSRTEGLTWATWGFVLGAIFLMYAATGRLAGAAGLPGWAALLWVPWVLAGAAFSAALWRSAGLASPLPAARPAGALVTLAWLGSILIGFALLDLALGLLSMPHDESMPVAAVGLAWLLMSAFGWFRATQEGRVAILVIGLVTLAAGVALVFGLPPADYGAPAEGVVRFGHDMLRALAAAAPPLLVGLWQALRG